MLLCIVSAGMVSQDKKEKIYRLADQLADLRRDLIARVSHTEPCRAHAYYRALEADGATQVQRIISELETLFAQ